MTGSEDLENQDRAPRDGAVAYLHKPFSDEMLLAAIRAALRSRGEHIVPIAIVPTAEEPWRAAANGGDRLFAVETHTSPGSPVLRALPELRGYVASEADNPEAVSASHRNQRNFGISNLKGCESNHRLIPKTDVPCPMCRPPARG